MLSKIKEFVKVHQADIILVIGVILISLLSFAMGYITAKYQEKEPIRFEMTNDHFYARSLFKIMPKFKFEFKFIRDQIGDSHL